MYVRAIRFPDLVGRLRQRLPCVKGGFGGAKTYFLGAGDRTRFASSPGKPHGWSNIMDGWMPTGLLPAVIHPWTLPRAKKVSTGHFFTLPYGKAALFESTTAIKKTAAQKGNCLFWYGCS